ncbi:hypothetical protein P8452_00197 [Trifolium repens]|nr:hypothetical protein P8452_00197 [Trifolium repens]
MAQQLVIEKLSSNLCILLSPLQWLHIEVIFVNIAFVNSIVFLALFITHRRRPYLRICGKFRQLFCLCRSKFYLVHNICCRGGVKNCWNMNEVMNSVAEKLRTEDEQLSANKI